MSLEGLPGGEPEPTMRMTVSRETRFYGVVLAGIEPAAQGGSEVSFLVPQTGELLVFPLTAQAAEEIGRKLLAPRVALPSNGRQ